MIQPIIADFKTITCPCFTFLIQHPSGRNLVFDLGIRKDWKNAAPSILSMTNQGGITIEVEKDVATILTENGVNTKDVEAVIWSHYHFDHIGNPATFPGSTTLIVGPGFKGRFPNAYPTDEKSALTEDAWAGRELREISFEDSNLKIGRFKAVDYFGDGSFYLLDTPGHLLGHLCALARTTADTYIFMGGDAAHHAGEIRPTEYIPLPHEVKLNPNPPHFPHCCPGELLMNDVHPEKSATKPFYHAADGFNENGEVADWTLDGVTEFDANERVFVVIAHDSSLLDVLDFYPKGANEWKSKNWRSQGRWRFLAHFSAGLEDVKAAGRL